MRFVLIHGAYHDSWCWHLLRQELLRQGHQVVAPDLPTDDPEAGADGYASLVLKAIEPSGEPAILVGHSLAGLTLPVVAARMPTQLMVFLCALLPVPGLSFDQQGAQMDSGFRASQPPIANADGSTSWKSAHAAEKPDRASSVAEAEADSPGPEIAYSAPSPGLVRSIGWVPHSAANRS